MEVMSFDFHTTCYFSPNFGQYTIANTHMYMYTHSHMYTYTLTHAYIQTHTCKNALYLYKKRIHIIKYTASVFFSTHLNFQRKSIYTWY